MQLNDSIKICKFINYANGCEMFVDGIELMLSVEHALYFRYIYKQLGYEIKEA